MTDVDPVAAAGFPVAVLFVPWEQFPQGDAVVIAIIKARDANNTDLAETRVELSLFR